MKTCHLRNSRGRGRVHSWKRSTDRASIRVKTEKTAATEVDEERVPGKEIRTEDRAADGGDVEDVVSLQTEKM